MRCGRGARPRRLVRVALYVAYLAVVTAALLELGLRFSGYAERHIYDPIYQRFERSADIPYVHKPNLVRARARGLAVVDTDALGLRSMHAGERLGPKAASELRIAILGDSVTFGEGVPRTEDTFAHVLEDELARSLGCAAVRVLNFGVSAYSVKEMVASLEHRVIDVEPDLVVLALIPSDLRLSRTPGVDDAGYLVHAQESWLGVPIVRDVLRSVHLLYLVREMRGRWDRWMSGGRAAWAEDGDIPESYGYVRRFKDVAAERRVGHLVVLLPHPRQGAWGAMPARLERDGIAHVDLSPLVRDLSREEFAASRFDSHHSPAVHRRIGRALAAHLRPAIEEGLAASGSAQRSGT